MERVKHCRCDDPEVSVSKMDSAVQITCHTCGSGEAIRTNMPAGHEDYDTSMARLRDFVQQAASRAVATQLANEQAEKEKAAVDAGREDEPAPAVDVDAIAEEVEPSDDDE